MEEVRGKRGDARKRGDQQTAVDPRGESWEQEQQINIKQKDSRTPLIAPTVISVHFTVTLCLLAPCHLTDG